VFAVLAASGVVLGAIYMLWMYQRVFLGPVTNEKNRGLPDLSFREGLVLAPIILFAIWLGVRPGLVLDPMEASIERVMTPIVELSEAAATDATPGAAGTELALEETQR